MCQINWVRIVNFEIFFDHAAHKPLSGLVAPEKFISAQSQINRRIQSTPPGHFTAKFRYFPRRPSPHCSQTAVLQQA